MAIEEKLAAANPAVAYQSDLASSHNNLGLLYSDTSRLKEAGGAHKAALAKSIEGFKREAPDYKQEITASVFGEILSNPSSRPSPEPAQHPIFEAILKKIPELISAKKKPS